MANVHHRERGAEKVGDLSMVKNPIKRLMDS